MKRAPDLPVEILVGGPLSEIASHPLRPYSSEAIAFLAELSKTLLANPAIRTYPDIAGFAYWCRRSNLSRLSRTLNARERRIGRGVVLHIAPANVPVNFAFSLAFGMLAGNANIVRLPEANHPQAQIIYTEIGRILGRSQHARIAAMTRIVRYPRNDDITSALSESCHARILWGGDTTIAHLRKMPTSPRCVDIAFADRYSMCIMDAEALLAVEDEALNALASGFYNDVFLLDQNACSSPHLVFWRGANARVEAAMGRFWKVMENYLLSRDIPPAIHALDKYAHLCRTSITLGAGVSVVRHQNLIYRLRLNDLPEDIENYRGQHGFFFEFLDSDFAKLQAVVGERYQTVTYFGIDPDEVINFVIDAGLTGIDRVVPVGKALDISVVWDGYDLIGTLSRLISDQ